MFARMARRPRVSPGFTPRPSLSAVAADRAVNHAGERVAGVHAPAFVERPNWRRVVGGDVRVSPGFTPRPSLSGLHEHLGGLRDVQCRRGSRPGLR